MTHGPSLTQLMLQGLRDGDAPMWIDDAGVQTRRAFEHSVASVLLQWRAHGLKPGDRVALCGELDRPLAAAFVAALFEGLVVVPVDAQLPAPRQQQMLQLAAPAAVFGFGAAPELPGLRLQRLDAASTTTLTLEAVGLPALDDDAPAYVFFTSGTTGVPKGVLGRRGGLAHFLAWEAEMLRLRPDDRVGLLTRLSFDVVLRDLLLPLVGGIAGCLPPAGRTAGELLQWLQQRQVSVLHAVPSLAQAWLSAWPAAARLPALRHTLFAGEPLAGALVQRWRERCPASAVHNLYGPTETTLAKFWSRVPEPADPGLQHCGHPLPQAEAVIVDEAGAPLPLQTLGEVAIRTPHASLGYLDPAEPSQANFRLLQGRPAYFTGDLGCLDAQGRLHLRGRKDHQLKLHGVRVEPAGVAALLQAHGAVQQAAVIALHDHARNAPQLVAYYTVQAGAVASARDLRRFLAERLPAPAVPAHFIALDDWPVTPNGKLDRERLPAPAATTSPEAPADALEHAVAEAMAEALDRDEVGVLDDFFSLGGDSLAATELALALERRGPWHLQPSMLLHAPTVRELAARLRGQAAPPPIAPAPRERWFALSPQQRRYLRCFCAGGSRSWCNMVALIPLPDGVERAAVQAALVETTLRHDSLRLVFAPDAQGEVVQAIDASFDIALPVIDLAAMRPEQVEARLQALRIAEGARPIEPFGPGPLFRATLLLLPQGRRQLLWNVHHLVSDGRSQALLAEELQRRLSTPDAELPPLPSVRDIAAWARQREGLPAAQAHIRRLFDTPYAHPYLPERQHRADPQRCHAFETALAGPVREAVRALARSRGCTPYAVYVAGHLRLLAEATGSDDIAIVTPLAGRAHPALAGVIGDFINLVPLRVRGLRRFAGAALVDEVRRQVAEAAEHQAWQFDEVLDQLHIAPGADRHPLTGCSLNYMPQRDAAPRAPAGHVDRGYKLKYDLLFLLRDHRDALHVELQYRAGLLSPGDAQALVAGYERQLQGLCDG